MIEKTKTIDLITVTESNFVHVREVTRFIEDGVVMSETYHRWLLKPGDDVSGQDEKIRSVCMALWS